jgi:hypothetical protein
MAYGDWDNAFQENYDHIPGTDHIEPDLEAYAELLYEQGFTHSADELDRLGISEDDVQFARDEFFDFLGIDQADFDWEGWREAMGYE